MRPLQLEMEGFATFRERTELDFTDLDLVAFVGATGAGKSTIIDAITFALYGSVARYDHANMVAPVIHQLSTEARVRLDFELGGQTYTAVRVVRRQGTRSRARDAATGSGGGSSTGGATTKEARLERLIDGESVDVLAGSVRELDAAVAELVGLDFSQFTRTVVLPQGQFAQFLKDEPASRQKLLRSLLDLNIYHRMGVLAREEAKKAAQQAEALEAELARHKPVTDNDLQVMAGQIGALTELRAQAVDAVEALDKLDRELNPVRDQVNLIDQQLQALGGVSIPDGVGETDRLLSEADTAIEALGVEVDVARSAWEEARLATESDPDRAELQSILSQIDHLTAVECDLAHTSAELAELEGLVVEATADHERLEQRALSAQARLTELRRHADAESWVAQLVAGEPCPVCRQTVDAIPEHLPDAAVVDADAEARAAATAQAGAAKTLSSLQGRVQAARERADRQSTQASELQEALGDGDTAGRRAAIEHHIVEVDKRATAAKAAFERVGELDAQLAKLRRDRSALADRTREWTLTLSSQRDQVSALEPPPLEHNSLFDDWSALATWADGQADALGQQRAELAERGKALAARRRDQLGELNALLGPHGIEAQPGEAVEAIAVARSEAAARLETANERREERRRLQGRVDELSADREINRVLGQHLSANGFEGWLLNEALDNIVIRASVWLRELSGGSYSLTVDNREFAIIDHNNADEQRDVRTLSGGETFLTSLSLALALADSIADLAPVDSPRLESMFLDEGFGTLDGATLDVVAAAIEELASTGRMIGIVTHVRDLAERMPSRFEVQKTAAGSTVELVQL